MTDWKRKLAAYLHDPPSKCLGIRDHEEHAKTMFRQAGFDAEEADDYARHFAQPSDWTASAADRLPFPRRVAASVSCQFDGHRNQFHHALGPHAGDLSASLFQFHAPFTSVELARETDQGVQPVLTDASLAPFDEADRWKARFFAHWRLWPRNCVEKDYRFAFLPADTRLPDHTVWTHMQVVSALDGCADRPGKDAVLAPAFLKFQLGPVQDFIAAARSVRDLWSGSYLLSWLMAAGLKTLSAKVGPDAVIFPNLQGQPLFDLHWREELWRKVNIGTQNVWESLEWSERELLTPNLPNVFLAVVPAAEASALAKELADAIRAEWRRIADAVWEECKGAGLTADEMNDRGELVMSEQSRKDRFHAQVKRFLSLSWQVTPWPDSLEATFKLADGFVDGMPIIEARKRVQAVVEMAEKQMPVDHRDGRFYVGGSGGPKAKLNNIGLGWSMILALNSWELDAVRQTRTFDAANPGGWQVGTFGNKDALTGREEAVAGGDKWFATCKDLGEFWSKRFKKPHWLGAPTLIKRLWDIAYLQPKWGLNVQKSPNTRGIAAHDPFATDPQFNDEDEAGDIEAIPPSEKYFAVLAFDGDEIGKWISGEKTPKFSTQLADYQDGSGNPGFGSKPYFTRSEFGKFLEAQRPLSPSYHLQFSEALSNFALLCARPIVEAFDGRLIYAGGDDVVALLPADTALACAQALRMAFQGAPELKQILHATAGILRDRHLAAQRADPQASPPPHYQKLAAQGSLFDTEHAGFLTRLEKLDQQGRPIPFLVPGPAADCSVGIAIAHFKAPLQDVVREAQRAEKRAKRKPEAGGLDRQAAAVTLMKRSGEIVEWGAKWDGGLELYREMAAALEAGQLSGKFPHRFVELLDAYLTGTTPLLRESQTIQAVDGFPVDAIIQREFDHCLGRQRGPKFPTEKGSADALLAAWRGSLMTYLKALDNAAATKPETRLQAVIGLCQTVAFAHRTAAGTETNPEPKGNA
jgi:CRISPR-associated protein Cas10/Cmr2 subtype III-B